MKLLSNDNMFLPTAMLTEETEQLNYQLSETAQHTLHDRVSVGLVLAVYSHQRGNGVDEETAKLHSKNLLDMMINDGACSIAVLDEFDELIKQQQPNGLYVTTADEAPKKHVHLLTTIMRFCNSNVDEMTEDEKMAVTEFTTAASKCQEATDRLLAMVGDTIVKRTNELCNEYTAIPAEFSASIV